MQRCARALLVHIARHPRQAIKVASPENVVYLIRDGNRLVREDGPAFAALGKSTVGFGRDSSLFIGRLSTFRAGLLVRKSLIRAQVGEPKQAL